MEKVIDLKDLLKHEIMDLYSAEEQIIEALPLMIEKAGNDKLKAALTDHLKVTEEQKSRLDEIKQLLGEEPATGENGEESKAAGFFSRLFGGGSEKCKGMEGLISEGQKMMSSDMSPEASDAAIIASAQKIEHYEISGYGTARAFARELNLSEVSAKLEQTLNEEYAADDLLTTLAVGQINPEAEVANETEKNNSSSKSSKAKSNGKVNNGGSAAKKKISIPVKSNAKASAVKKSATKTAPVKSSASKSAGSAVKKSSSKGRNNRVPVKSQPAVKKSAAKSSKGNNKSSAKSKSRGR